MLIGYNNDVQHRGKTFHIQTEDRGAPSNQIETQIFHSGAILDTRIISYEDKLAGVNDRATRNKSIKQLMQTTHRELYKNLLSGKYDEFAGLEPLADVESDVEVDDKIEDFTPSQERVPQAALELEEKGAEAFQFEEGGDHVDISSLKSRLAAMGAGEDDDEDEEVEDDDLATQVVADLDEMPRIVQSGGAKSSEGLPNKPVFSIATAPKGNPAVGYKATGASAWNGCLPSTEDLSLVDLVEAFIAK